MTGSLRALLRDLFDYAGLFPPAGLGMAEAIRNYAAYRSGPHAWMLGRFVLPSARLEEFATAAGDAVMYAAEPWRLAVVLSDDQAAFRAIRAFNSRGGAVVDTAEGRAADVETIARIDDNTLPGLSLFIELPPEADRALFGAVVTCGARAKVRAGGVTAAAFPAQESLLGFMANCRASGAAWKATAGLHHAIRGSYRLTYEPDAASAPMFGFVNLAMAAALMHSGADLHAVGGALAERELSSFDFRAGAAAWNGLRLDISQLEAARETFVSIGSCSFEEPVAELAALGLLDSTVGTST